MFFLCSYFVTQPKNRAAGPTPARAGDSPDRNQGELPGSLWIFPGKGGANCGDQKNGAVAGTAN